VTDETCFPLRERPVHLGLGATVVPQPTLTGDVDWYQDYEVRNVSDGAEGRLVTMHSFTEPWDSWEVHPFGEELVVCLEGAVTLHQEFVGEIRSATIRAGEAVINPRGIWHTADVAGAATALFITAGTGTENRPR
jgi:quercetin dioxygenase-like cupin family protein